MQRTARDGSKEATADERAETKKIMIYSDKVINNHQKGGPYDATDGQYE
jgi:hypothetical protein